MPLSRRNFCGALAASCAIAKSSAFGEEPKSIPLRVIAYNIYGLKGWPHQSDLAKQAVAEGQMVKRLASELAKYQPDIINFSESPGEDLTKEVAELLGMHHVRFPSAGNWPGTLLSKFEIIESENVPLKDERPKELFTRHWGRALLQLPNEDELIVHSAHLFPTADPTIRRKEIHAMLETMKDDLAAGRSMLLIGDLNHRPDTVEYGLWSKAGWIDTFAKVGHGDGPTIKADIPKYRIDYIMAAGPIAERTFESRPLFEGAFRLNPDEQDAFALSDHLPQLAVFK